MHQEIDAHTKGGNWEIMRRRHIPNTATVLPAVWSMKRKRRISDRKVYKWKARLNIDGSRQIQGLHYQDTYSPVVSWSTTRFFPDTHATEGMVHQANRLCDGIPASPRRT
jgi:hypothetical protein